MFRFDGSDTCGPIVTILSIFVVPVKQGHFGSA